MQSPAIFQDLRSQVWPHEGARLLLRILLTRAGSGWFRGPLGSRNPRAGSPDPA
ncbi:hypothetical protein P7K49_023793 [Saguinus oedipus]|uniref:Uncharacterized protein n=1 Tax=Saguinus oedipus TaxID=9490 RepID=A0ABQ9UMP3_SAGOE|nr:hypothetical protein P7K49_023793 [Saguinus oedipus]